MGRYNRTNVSQAAIIYLDCISVKYLVHGMIPWNHSMYTIYIWIFFEVVVGGFFEIAVES